MVIRYASDKDAQHTYINQARERGYEVLLLDSPIVGHLIQKLETSKENISFSRVDSDSIDNLIKKDEEKISKLSEQEQETLKTTLDEMIPKDKSTVQIEALDSNESTLTI